MILDTDFLINLMEEDRGAKIKLVEFLKSGEPLSVCAITIMELFHGFSRVNKPQEEESKIHEVLHGLIVHPIDFDLARNAGKLEGSLVKKNAVIGMADALIATVALSAGEPVVTRNVKDFSKIAGLEIVTY